MDEEPDELRLVRSRSFGSVAADYDRFRPGPSAEVVEWLVPASAGTVVDVGAGTGALTVLLASRFARVVAVEPDGRMRAVLVAKGLEVEVLEGSGESLPLLDGSADALVASSSWHWLDPARAVPEIARVLRPGGRLGVVWSGINRHQLGLDERAFARLRNSSEPIGEGAPVPGEGEADRRQGWLGHELVLPAGAPFDEPEYREIDWVQPMSVDELVGNIGTYSRVILLPEAEQVRVAETARAYMKERYGVEGGGTIDVPFRARCWRTKRL